MLKKYIKKITFYLGIGLICILSLIAITTISLLPLSKYYIANHIQDIEKWATTTLDQPILIKSANIEAKGLMPIVHLHDISMLDDMSVNVLAKIQDIEIRINVIKSITNLSLVPGSVSIKGADVSLYKNDDGHITITNPETKTSHDSTYKKKFLLIDDVIAWLFIIDKINISSTKINWLDTHGTEITLNFNNLSLNSNATPLKASLIKEDGNLIKLFPRALNFKFESTPSSLVVKLSEDKKALETWLNNAFSNDNNFAGSMMLYKTSIEPGNRYKKGNFLVSLGLNNASLNYASKWPSLYKINGNLLFDGNFIKIYADSGTINGTPFYDVKAEILDLSNPILDIDGKVNCEMENANNFLENSPLKEGIGEKLKNLSIKGPLTLSLKLIFPLGSESSPSTIHGDITLHDNSLHLQTIGLEVKNINGSLSFTGKDVSSTNISGLLLDEITNFSLNTLNVKSDNPITQVNIQGALDSKKLLTKINPKFSTYADGTINYNASLQINDNKSSTYDNVFQLKSDLKNVKITLPMPFAKSKEEIAPLSIIYQLKGKKWRTFNLSFKKNSDNFVRCNVVNKSSGKDSQEAQSKISITADTGKIKFADWSSYLGNSSSQSKSIYPSISDFTLNVNDLNIFGQNLIKAKIKLYQGESTKILSGNINSQDIDGTFTVAKNKTRPSIKGIFSKLNIKKSKEKSDVNLNPKNVFPFEIVSSNFQYDNKPLGHLDLKTSSYSDGLNIDNLSLNSPLFHLKANGKWFNQNSGQKTTLYGEFSTHNLGDLMRKFELGDNLEKGAGKADFAVSWNKAFFSPDFDTILGVVKLSFYNGQIINLGQRAESQLGLGRLLNLFSLQSIPRRLTLDFSDLTAKGFSFDRFYGDLDLKQNNVFIQDVNLEGQLANVRVQGRVGLKIKDYDLKLFTSAHITSSIPVVAAFALGPVAGAATWLANEFVTSQSKNTSKTPTFSITGSWAKPNIVKSE